MFEAYGHKDYRLDTMQYKFYIGTRSSARTTGNAWMYLSGECHANVNGNYLRLSSYTYGNAAAANSYFVNNGGETYGGVNFDGINATCYGHAEIISGQQDDIHTNFNGNSVGYPSIISAGLYQNPLTNQYLVQFDGINPNGGICKAWYYVLIGSGQSFSWIQEMPDCPTNYSYWEILNITQPIGSGVPVYFGVSLKPALGDEEMYTSGHGVYYFDNGARAITIKGNQVIPFVNKALTESENDQSTAQSTDFLQKQIAIDMANS